MILSEKTNYVNIKRYKGKIEIKFKTLEGYH